MAYKTKAQLAALAKKKREERAKLSPEERADKRREADRRYRESHRDQRRKSQRIHPRGASHG